MAHGESLDSQISILYDTVPVLCAQIVNVVDWWWVGFGSAVLLTSVCNETQGRHWEYDKSCLTSPAVLQFVSRSSHHKNTRWGLSRRLSMSIIVSVRAIVHDEMGEKLLNSRWWHGEVNGSVQCPLLSIWLELVQNTSCNRWRWWSRCRREHGMVDLFLLFHYLNVFNQSVSMWAGCRCAQLRMVDKKAFANCFRSLFLEASRRFRGFSVDLVIVMYSFCSAKPSGTHFYFGLWLINFLHFLSVSHWAILICTGEAYNSV